MKYQIVPGSVDSDGNICTLSCCKMDWTDTKHVSFEVGVIEEYPGEPTLSEFIDIERQYLEAGLPSNLTIDKLS